jgi:hypothetical protein
MVLRYNVVELNTSVKPYIFDHILKQEPEFNKIVYFDPDIMVFQPLKDLFTKLDSYNIVVTPHILSPSDNNPNVPQETSFLATGIFNLGFIAIKRSEEIYKFINWWKERLLHKGYARLTDHLFFDQIWINFAPVFFDGVCIEKNIGCNMAPWNLHERVLRKVNKVFIINENSPLIFFHFSSYKVDNPLQIASTTKYTFDMRPDLKEIFESYRNQLLTNGEYYFKEQAYFFTSYKIEILRSRALDNSTRLMKKLRLIKYSIEEKLKLKSINR